MASFDIKLKHSFIVFGAFRDQMADKNEIYSDRSDSDWWRHRHSLELGLVARRCSFSIADSFGNSVYSRLNSARINEETLRWINHNINVMNRAKHEWKINPKFMA